MFISKGLRHSADPLEFRIGGQWGAAQVTGLGWSGVEWKGVFSIEMVWIGVESIGGRLSGVDWCRLECVEWSGAERNGVGCSEVECSGMTWRGV